MPDPLKKDDSLAADRYSDYENGSRYEWDSGTIAMPTADGPPVVVQLHRGMMIRRQSAYARKAGQPPVLPGPARGQTLLGQTVELPLPQPNPDGTTFDYRVGVEYTYLLPDATATGGYGTASGNPWPYSMPALDALQAYANAGAAAAGGSFTPAVVTPDFVNGYTWPWPLYYPDAFFDPTLS